MWWHQHSTQIGVSALTLYLTRYDVAVSDSKAKLSQAYSKAKLSQAHLIQRPMLRQAHSNAKLQQAYPVKQYFKRTRTRPSTSEIWSTNHRTKTFSSNASLALAAQRLLTTTNPSPLIIQHFSRVWQGHPQSQLACSIPHLYVQRVWLGGGCRSGLSSVNRGWWSWSGVCGLTCNLFLKIWTFIVLSQPTLGFSRRLPVPFKPSTADSRYHVVDCLEYVMTGFGYKSLEASKVSSLKEPQCEHLDKDAASSLGRYKRLSSTMRSSDILCDSTIFKIYF